MTHGLRHYNSQYLYRVLRPDEDHTQDLRCLAPTSTRDISEHVESGLRIPSKYISTSASKECALKWFEKADRGTFNIYQNRRTVIVKIDVNLLKSKYPKVVAKAIDLSNFQNREFFLKSSLQKQFSNSTKEVLFEDFIPSEAVSVEYIKNSDNKLGVKRKILQIEMCNNTIPSKSIKLDSPKEGKKNGSSDLDPNGINPLPIQVSKQTELKVVPVPIQTTSEQNGLEATQEPVQTASKSTEHTAIRICKQTVLTSYFTPIKRTCRKVITEVPSTKETLHEGGDHWARAKRTMDSSNLPESKRTCHLMKRSQSPDILALFSTFVSEK